MTSVPEVIGEGPWAIIASRKYVDIAHEPTAVYVHLSEEALFARYKPAEPFPEWKELADQYNIPLWVGIMSDHPSPPFLIGPGVLAMYARLPVSAKYPEQESEFARRYYTRLGKIFTDDPKLKDNFACDQHGNFAGGVRWEVEEEDDPSWVDENSVLTPRSGDPTYKLSVYVYLNYTESVAFNEYQDLVGELSYNTCHFESAADAPTQDIDSLIRAGQYLTEKVMREEFDTELSNLRDDNEVVIDNIYSLRETAEENYLVP